MDLAISGARLGTWERLTRKKGKSWDSAIYVTFVPAILAGCNSSYGGYLSSTWPDAMVGLPSDPTAPGAQLALLLSAKAMVSILEVRYLVNTTGTGWDKCAIDALWLQ